jgi:hypothetical protein
MLPKFSHKIFPRYMVLKFSYHFLHVYTHGMYKYSYHHGISKVSYNYNMHVLYIKKNVMYLWNLMYMYNIIFVHGYCYKTQIFIYNSFWNKCIIIIPV